MRTLVYARYSSQLQDRRSIEDQLRVCRDRCAREGWDIVAEFTDYEISGKVYARPGLQAMLDRVAAGDVDQVMAEALDRLARDEVDTPLIRRKVEFAGARIFTLSQGHVTVLHTALQGAWDAQQLKELAAKVRRGQRGRTAAGFSFGQPAYGYRIVRQVDERTGEIEKGLRQVDEAQAAIVRRIFDEFAAGRSPLAIARDLNREGVPSPSAQPGKPSLWRVSTINGDRIRRNGILHNDLYRGQLVYNKTRKETDPETRRRVIRSNPRSEWQVTDVPRLRIVSDAQWTAVESRRDRLEDVPAHRQRRPKRLLSGLGRCGECGGAWIVAGVDRWGCSTHKSGTGNCGNGRTITNREYERRVLGGLHQQLLHPDAVDLYVREYRRRYAQLARDRGAGERDARRALAAAQAKVANLVAAIEEGGSAFAEIRSALAAAKREADEAQATLSVIAAEAAVPLHPRLPERYRQEFTALMAALEEPAARQAALEGIRSLVDWIRVGPAPQGRGVAIEVFGRLNTVLALASGQKPTASECLLRPVPGVWFGRKPTLLRAVV